MAFELNKDPMNIQAEAIEISSITVVVGDLLEVSSGAAESWTLCTSTSEWWTEKAVAIEAATTSDSEVKAILVHPLQLWNVELANNSNTSHNNQRMILTDANTVNNTGSNSTTNAAIFRQHSAVGVVGDQRATGYFMTGSGIDEPSAS